MAVWCLLPKYVDAFKKDLLDGTITPEKLHNMTPDKRLAFFEERFGKTTAKNLELEFEKKLLLKERQLTVTERKGILVEQLGMTKGEANVADLKYRVEKKKLKRDLLTDELNTLLGSDVAEALENATNSKNRDLRAIKFIESATGLNGEAKAALKEKLQKNAKERERRVFDPKEDEVFLKELAKDIVGRRYRLDFTDVEVKTISDLTKEVDETRKVLEAGGDRFEYGNARAVLNDYTANLKLEANKAQFKEYLNPIKALDYVASFAKSTKASLDNSSLFRQGWKTIFTNPKTFVKNSAQSFKDISDTLTNKKDVTLAVMADVLSRDNELNGYYKQGKLDLGVVEEAFPTSLPEKIPGVGRLFKASDVAYSSFLTRMRADIFDQYISVAENNGVELTKETLRGYGNLVNSLTGRGDIGRLEGVKEINSLFFSPKFLKSQFDFLTAHSLDKKVPASVKKEARKNLLKNIAGVAVIMAIVNAINPDFIEEDPRSADFGKIKIGDTRFDITGGMGSILVLASRLITNSTKSTATGIVRKFGNGFGEKNGYDVLIDFMSNRFSPMTQLAKNLLEKQDWGGNAVTWQGATYDFLMPLGIQNALETSQNPNSAPLIAAVIADGLGISTNTYGIDVEWERNTGEELLQFKEEIGDEKFKQANDKFNVEYRKELKELQDTEGYQGLSNKGKVDAVTRIKTRIKKDIFKEYGFKYKEEEDPESKTIKQLTR